MPTTANISVINEPFSRAATELAARDKTFSSRRVMKRNPEQTLSDMEIVILVGVIIAVLSLSLT
jgi:hypothetical protein